MSLLKRLRMRPTGFVSKKWMGVLTTARNMASCSACDERMVASKYVMAR